MSDNRARLTIEQPGKPYLYQPHDLPGWESIGTVTRGTSDIGALVRNKNTGIYGQANAGVVRSLDQRKIQAALGIKSNPVGRPAEMAGGKRRNVYIDDLTWEQVTAIGDGNASEGIRRAVAALNLTIKKRSE